MFIIVKKAVKYRITGVYLGFFDYLCSTKEVERHAYTKVVNIKYLQL